MRTRVATIAKGGSAARAIRSVLSVSVFPPSTGAAQPATIGSVLSAPNASPVSNAPTAGWAVSAITTAPIIQTPAISLSFPVTRPGAACFNTASLTPRRMIATTVSGWSSNRPRHGPSAKVLLPEGWGSLIRTSCPVPCCHRHRRSCHRGHLAGRLERHPDVRRFPRDLFTQVLSFS